MLNFDASEWIKNLFTETVRDEDVHDQHVLPDIRVLKNFFQAESNLTTNKRSGAYLSRMMAIDTREYRHSIFDSPTEATHSERSVHAVLEELKLVTERLSVEAERRIRAEALLEEARRVADTAREDARHAYEALGEERERRFDQDLALP